MSSIDQLRERMERAKDIQNVMDRRMWVLSILTEACSEIGVKPILVGGAAVEFYTVGGYSTGDVDVITPLYAPMDKLMGDLGFEKKGRHWEIHDVFIEAPPPPLAGDQNRVMEVDVDGRPVYVIGIEDLIIDRLNACVHWRSEEDCRWAQRLITENRDDLDLEYLKSRASVEDTQSRLMDMLKEDV